MPWTIEDVQDLLTLESGESEILEFKEDLPAYSDKGKAEVLKDVSAMLNSSGGTIIYGIRENDGKAASLSIPKINEVDENIRRIAQLIQAGIEPAADIKSSVLTLKDGEVLIVEVPQSFAGPFRFKFNDKYRFVKRYERHIGDFTYEQLRSAFSASSDRLDKIERWWKNVSPSDYFSRPMLGGPQMTCALVPVAFDGRNTLLEPTKVESHWPSMIMNGWEMKTVGGNGFEDSHEGTIADIEAGPVFISDIDAVDESTVELFAQIADRLWQAYGVARCPRKLLSDPI